MIVSSRKPLWLASWYLLSCMGHASAAVEETSTITSTACSNIRNSDSFRARLDLLYLYQIDYVVPPGEEAAPDLAGLGRVIATALARALDRCDEQDRPATAIQITPSLGHELSSSEVCQSASNETSCKVVRGLTSILLDGKASEIAPIAFAVIDLVLNDVAQLNQLSRTTFVGGEYMYSLSHNVVLLQSHNESDNKAAGFTIRGSLMVAVLSALAAFFATFVCLCCMWRKRGSVVLAGRSKRNRRVTFSWPSNRQQYWKQLADDNNSQNVLKDEHDAHHHWMMATLMTSNAAIAAASMPVQQIRTGNLAVSDLTSDSESIRSSLKMESIKEEESMEADTSFADELVMAELAMAESEVSNHASTSYTHSAESSWSYNAFSSTQNHESLTNTEELDDTEARTECVSTSCHLDRTTSVNEDLSQTASCPGRLSLEKVRKHVLEAEDFDPDAATPVRSNVEQLKITDFDALGTGDSYMADISEDEDVEVGGPIFLPTVENEEHDCLSLSDHGLEKMLDSSPDTEIEPPGGDLSLLESHFHAMFEDADLDFTPDPDQTEIRGDNEIIEMDEKEGREQNVQALKDLSILVNTEQRCSFQDQQMARLISPDSLSEQSQIEKDSDEREAECGQKENVPLQEMSNLQCCQEENVPLQEMSNLLPSVTQADLHRECKIEGEHLSYASEKEIVSQTESAVIPDTSEELEVALDEAPRLEENDISGNADDELNISSSSGQESFGSEPSGDIQSSSLSRSKNASCFFSPDADECNKIMEPGHSMFRHSSIGHSNAEVHTTDLLATPTNKSAEVYAYPVPSKLKELTNDRLQDGEICENAFEELTSPEGVQFLDDSSNDGIGGNLSKDHSLQDLRLLGPVTDSTSEDYTSFARTVTEDQSSESSSDSTDEECATQNASGMSQKFDLPYTLNPSTSDPMGVVDLSDVSNANDTDSSTHDVKLEMNVSILSI